MIFDKLKAYGWMAVAIAATSALGVQTFRLHVSQLSEAKAISTLANERAVAADGRAKQVDTFRKSELLLVTESFETRKVTHEKVSNLAVRNDALLQRVRNAESTKLVVDMPSTTTAPTDGEAVSGILKPELLGSFGEEDVREASRADTIRLHLEACYRDYDRAAETLKALGIAK